MKQKLINLLFLALAVVAFLPAEAQIKKIEYASFDADTLTNGGTLTFVYSNLAIDDYDMSWQFSASNISGTTAGTVTLEASNCQSCSDWAVVDTFTLTASALNKIFISQNFPGLRARLKVVGSGTQSSQIRNHVLWRRRKP